MAKAPKFNVGDLLINKHTKSVKDIMRVSHIEIHYNNEILYFDDRKEASYHMGVEENLARLVMEDK